MIELVKEYIHEDIIDKYDWNIIESNMVYDNDYDCYIISSTDWVFYIDKTGELLKFELKI